MMFFRVLQTFCIPIAALAACAPSYSGLEPVLTTYPRERAEVQTQRVWVAPGIKYWSNIQILSGLNKDGSSLYESKSSAVGQPTLDIKVSVVGESSTKELYILPNSDNGSSEKDLLDRVQLYGRRECGGDFRVAQMVYYFGGEVTLSMEGIQTNALNVRFRCPVRESAVNTRESILRQYARNFNDLGFFDYVEFQLEGSIEKNRKRLYSVLQNQNSAIIREDNISEKYLATAMSSKGRPTVWQSSEELAIIMEESNDSTYVGIILLSSQVAMYTRTGRTSTIIGIAPFDRNIAYERTKRFAGQMQ